jgi:4-hydroxybenzoate polyprenyltransferase
MKTLLLRLEGSFWMMRVSWALDAPIIVPAGWMAASRAPGYDMVAMMGAIGAGAAVTNILNDILDAEKDQLTGDTELLLANGVVSLTQAAATAAILALTLVGLLAVASADSTSFILALTAICLCVPLVGTYSYVKQNGLILPLVGGLVYAAIPFSTWLATGGGGDELLVVAVVGYALLFGLAAVILATLRDVDSEAAVGNRSIATRIGPAATLRLAACVDVIVHCCVIFVAAHQGRLAIGAPLAVASLVALLAAYRLAVRRQRSASGRHARTAAVRTLNLLRFGSQLALLAIFSLPLALLVGAPIAFLVTMLIVGYERRVFGGGLRRALMQTRVQAKLQGSSGMP